MILPLITLALLAAAAVLYAVSRQVRKRIMDSRRPWEDTNRWCQVANAARICLWLFVALALSLPVTRAVYHMWQVEYRAVYARVMAVRSRGETYEDAGLVLEIIAWDKKRAWAEVGNAIADWWIPDEYLEMPRIGGL